MTTKTLEKVSVNQHAIDRAITHFRVDKRVAEEWVRSQFKKASFIADIIGEDGRPTRLFAFQRIAFAVSDTENLIRTIYPQNHAVTELSVKVSAVLQRELRKAERQERSIERKVHVTKAELTVERAQCKYRMAVTPSKAVVRVNTARIAEINAKLADLDRELFDAKKAKSSVAKSLVAYL